MIDLRIQNGAIGLAASRTGTPDGQPVLFLHGITSCRDTWLEAMERLGDRFDCWALDFRGHGDSDRAPGAYGLADYASDADAVLQRIGRKTLLVGHSLGGMTSAHLGHNNHPLLAGVLLEDPPLYVSDPEVFATTVYPARFRLAREAVTRMRAEQATLDAYLELARTTPSAMGGVEGDHLTPRQLRSRSRQLASFDPACLDEAIDGRVFAGLDATRPICCPVTVLGANPAYGAAFLEGDDGRLLAGSPHARIVPFPEVGHAVHAATVSAARFLDVLDTFVTAHAT